MRKPDQRNAATVLRTLASVLLAYAATNAFCELARLPQRTSQSLGWMVAFIGIAYALHKALSPFSLPKEAPTPRSLRIAASALALVFAVCTVIGRALYDTDRLAPILYSTQTRISSLWQTLGLATLFYAMLLLPLLRRTVSMQEATLKPTKPRTFWVLWLLCIVCWLPWTLALAPGVISPDSMAQIDQVNGIAPLNNWHPLLHTGLIALCMKLGAWLGVPASLAVLPYTLFQMLTMSAIFTYATHAMLRMGVRRWYAFAVFALFALYPIHAVYSVTVWKDILHAGCTLLLVIELFHFARDPKAAFGSWRRIAALATLFFLCATLRHNGLYACLIILPFFLWRYRTHWRRALIVCLSAVSMIIIYRYPVLSLIQAKPTQSSEYLSVPAQFIGRVVTYFGKDLTQEERDIIGEILPIETIPEMYNAKISDPVKDVLNQTALAADPGRYATLFLRLLRQYPGLFAESFLLGNYGYWYPEADAIISFYQRGPYPRAVDLPVHSMTDWLDNRLRTAPGFSMLFSIGIMVWVLALSATICLLQRRKGMLLPFGLLALLWLTVLLSPVYAEYRYAYALILCAPVCFGIATWGQTTITSCQSPRVADDGSAAPAMHTNEKHASVTMRKKEDSL